MKRFFFFIPVTILILAATWIHAEESKRSFSAEEEKMEYAKGLNLGVIYSNGVDQKMHEAFLAGVRDGLANKKDSLSEEEMNDLLDKWISSRIEEGSNKPAYAFGWATGKTLLKQDSSIDPMILSQGLLDSFREESNAISLQEANDIITSYSKDKNKRFFIEQKKIYNKNKQIGEKFLQKNKEKEGIITLDSGLQYKILSNGHDAGSSPNLDSIVTIQVAAKDLSNKMIYDTSTDYGKPLEIKVSSTIEGWQEALQLMKPGEKWRLFVPEKLAFKEFGWQDKISPGETVIFDVELLSVE